MAVAALLTTGEVAWTPPNDATQPADRFAPRSITAPPRVGPEAGESDLSDGGPSVTSMNNTATKSAPALIVAAVVPRFFAVIVMNAGWWGATMIADGTSAIDGSCVTMTSVTGSPNGGSIIARTCAVSPTVTTTCGGARTRFPRGAGSSSFMIVTTAKSRSRVKGRRVLGCAVKWTVNCSSG